MQLVFLPARLGPQPSRWRQAVSWRLCRLETARTLWVLCRLGWGVTLAGKTTFSFVGERGVFTLQLVFACPAGDRFSACPAGAKTTFSFAAQKKKRFWTPKKKRWTSGNDYGLRYNRALDLCCYGIPRVRDFGVSFCFRRPAFERPVVPFASLPLRGWNAAPCSLVFTPPGWVVFGRGGVAWLGRLTDGGAHCGENHFFACPAGAKTTFSFVAQKKKRFWTPKKKR